MTRTRLRRIQLGIPTLLGWRRLGYFIPYRYAASLPDLGESPTYLPVQDLMRAKEHVFTTLMQAMQKYESRFEAFNYASPPLPRWQQDWFPRLDGLSTYTMIRDLKPARIVEVGTGHSTRFMARAPLPDPQLSWRPSPQWQCLARASGRQTRGSRS